MSVGLDGGVTMDVSRKGNVDYEQSRIQNRDRIADQKVGRRNRAALNFGREGYEVIVFVAGVHTGGRGIRENRSRQPASGFEQQMTRRGRQTGYRAGTAGRNRRL